MPNPHCAQKGPYAVTVEAGKKYAWCACGLSATQPFCDGAHKDTDLMPSVVTAETSETLYFCGCKATKTPPFCDGTHNSL